MVNTVATSIIIQVGVPTIKVLIKDAHDRSSNQVDTSKSNNNCFVNKTSNLKADQKTHPMPPALVESRNTLILLLLVNSSTRL